MSQPKPKLPHAVVLGDDAQRPGVRILPLLDEERFRAAKALPADSMLGGKLNSGLQAVPSLFVEEGHRGKQLMEVVVSGNLVRAGDGVGLRAWTVNANNRISEHAKLFEVDELQTVVNTAAMWQVASVIVAQKHLADISEKLDEIRRGIQDVSHFLDEARRSKVAGTYEYLELAASAIFNGELSPAVRLELESCDRNLLQVQHHLQQELIRRSTQAVERRETFGTGQLETDTVVKYERLHDVARDLRLTLKTRALAWYVLSLYPGESALKNARYHGICRSADEIEEFIQSIDSSVARDCDNFTHWLNKDITLEIRKTNVREAAEALATDLRDGMAETRAGMHASNALLLKHDAPTHLMFEVEDGYIRNLRIAAPT